MGKKSKSSKPEAQLSLDDVIKLGGTKEDFDVLKDVKDGVSSKKGKFKDDLKDDEFKAFFKSVGFDKIDSFADFDDDVPLQEFVKGDKTRKNKNELKKSASTEQATRSNVKKKLKQKPQQEQKQLKPKDETSAFIHRFQAPKSLPIQDSAVSSTTNEVAISDFSTAKPLSKIFYNIFELAKIVPKKLICKLECPWYSSSSAKLPAQTEQYEQNDSVVLKMKSIGRQLLENEATLFKNSKQRDDSNDAWMKTVMVSGTLSDKVAAYTMMLQKAPIHNYWCLDTFINMVKKKGKREAIIGLEALRDIFLAELLPEGRRLRYFHQQPIEVLKGIFTEETGGATAKRFDIQKHLIYWTYEEHLKISYKQVVESLRDFFMQDSLEALKFKGMRVALDLIKSKPEQERELLTMIVNKLGDPKHKIASKALHMLHCLIQQHPLMQGVVVSAVRDLLLRPNIQRKCQYYCICFLSAQILSRDRKDVADLLIQIYLGFFKAAITKKQVDNKLLSAILTGVNRAYPYANSDDDKILEELNVLYKTVHVSSFGTSVQALMLLFQVLSSRNEVSDRYYNALYSSLFHPELPICTSRHPMYLNLLFRSLKADISEARVKAFVKRLLQMTTLQLPSFTSAVLVLITELIRVKPGLKSLLDAKYHSASNSKSFSKNGTLSSNVVDDDEEEHFVDADKQEESKNDATEGNSTPGASWTHFHKESSVSRKTSEYDPHYRNPMYCNADRTSIWELHLLRSHYHPTVAKFADELGQVATSSLPDRYPGDPLQDFTTMRFLDKFVYRNPKARHEKEVNANIGQHMFRRKRKMHMADTQEVAANTPEFLAKKEYKPEELFLQRYFATKAAGEKRGKNSKKKKISEGDGNDIEEVNDDEFDEFLRSVEGKAQLQQEFDFAEGVKQSGPKKKKKQDIELDVGDLDDDEGAEDDVDFDEMDEDFGDVEEDFEDVGDDPFAGEGMEFGDVDNEDEPLAVKLRKKQGKKKNSTSDLEAFDMLLEENTHDKFGSSGSASVRNTDKSSVKQLQWERKKETKDIIARKRAQKRQFSKGNKKNFGGKKNIKSSRGKNFRRR